VLRSGITSVKFEKERARHVYSAAPPRLGHAAEIVRSGQRSRQIMLAVGYALEPRPTNAIEDEDDDEYDYDESPE
jgi:hypothetical protein